MRAPRNGPISAAIARPRAILFDWDNTLVDNWQAISEALNATLIAMGHDPWSVADTKARVRNSLRESFPAMFGERWTEARDIFYARFGQCHLDLLRPMADTAETLQALSRTEIYLGVVSNKAGHWLRREVEHLGWGRYFGQVVGAGDAVRDKPAVDPLRLALAPANLTPGPDTWLVGDAAVDMECAHNGGCIPVLVHAQAADQALFERYPPRHRLNDFKLLREALAV